MSDEAFSAWAARLMESLRKRESAAGCYVFDVKDLYRQGLTPEAAADVVTGRDWLGLQRAIEADRRDLAEHARKEGRTP